MAKDIVIEEEEPEEEKTKRVALDAGKGGASGEHDVEFDWETRESIPLQPVGGKLKFVQNPADKHNFDENANAVVTFIVEGNPVPKVEWFKDEEKDLSCSPRAKMWTDGSNNSITLGIKSLQSKDEGDYNCIITNDKGKARFDFKIYVTVEGGMDFRAMLMKKKRKEKKVIVQKVEWIEPLVDQEVQQGKCKQAVMSCKLSVKDKRGKWYMRNEEIMLDIKSGEHGRECTKGDKYDFKTEPDGTYILYVNNPTPVDDATYICLVKDMDTHTSGYLQVHHRDPEYFFIKRLKETENGLTARPYSLTVELSEPGAKMKWLKNGNEVDWVNEKQFTRTDVGCVHSINFDKCELDDSSYYSVRIEEFVKNDEEDQTNCWFQVDEYPHTFTSKMKEKRAIEKDKVTFKVNTEAEDATVTWYCGMKKIVPDGKRIIIEENGKERKMIINDVQLRDAGEISCKTNKDVRKTNLTVGILNEVIKPITSEDFRSMPGMVFGIEREDLNFFFEVKDPEAPVTFYMNGNPVDLSDSRVTQVNLGDGKHKLSLANTKLSDAGVVEARTPSNKDDGMVISTTDLDVMKGETAPKLGKGGKGIKTTLEGIANKECRLELDFDIEGKKQSDLDVKLSMDGKELKIGRDINLVIDETTGKLNVEFINPKHANSGKLKVQLGNAQGSCETDIDVNIMDKPDGPDACRVTDIFYDSCVVNWSPPKDDGGSEVVKYIIQELDLDGGSNWSDVAECGANDKKAKINNLKNNGRYKFRVIAVNKLGQSIPCENTGDVVIKDPWTEPSQPGKPKVVDWGPGHADLTWEVPETDGGAPITHYLIEVSENGVGWELGETHAIEQLRQSNGLVHGSCRILNEGSEYKFRVRAVNKRSTGALNYSIRSEESDTMMAKTRYIKASIHQPGMHNIEIKAGKTFRYDIWFNGEPTPDVIWEKKGVMIETNERQTLELFSRRGTYCEKNSVVTVRNANRKEDTGEYKIRLICGGGNFEATGFVNVLDVPDKPKNFRPTEVRAEYCVLQWDDPDDDGGSPIQKFQVSMMDLNIGEWVVCTENSDRRAKVDGLKPGNLYKFQVTAINKEGESKPMRLAEPVLAENPYQPPGEPGEPSIVDFDDKSVTLRWGKPQNDGGKPISHYIIQKKDMFGGWYEALVTNDDNCSATIADLEAKIPGLSLGKDYQFRVIAVTKAGESVPSVETKPHLCRYKNLEPLIDQTAGSKSVKVNRLTCWKITVKGEPPPTFSWHKDGKQLENSDTMEIVREEEQGCAIATLQILRTQMEDMGLYTLKASNRNGHAQVDLDLVVLDSVPECDCDMFKSGSLECQCHLKYRAEQLEDPLNPVNLSIGEGMNPVNLKATCDLGFVSDRSRDNVAINLLKTGPRRGSKGLSNGSRSGTPGKF